MTHHNHWRTCIFTQASAWLFEASKRSIQTQRLAFIQYRLLSSAPSARPRRPLPVTLSKQFIQTSTPSTRTAQGEWRSTIKFLRRQAKKEETSQLQKETLASSQKVVGLAILSNGIMFSSKLVAAIHSGSASMFSEALHSLADMFNECLLMLGIWRSLRKPDPNHPYGFSAERYAWALVSGVGELIT